MKIRKFNENKTDNDEKIFNDIKSIFAGLSDENDDIKIKFEKSYDKYTNPDIPKLVVSVYFTLNIKHKDYYNNASEFKTIVNSLKRSSDILIELERYIRILEDNDKYLFVISLRGLVLNQIDITIIENPNKL